MSLAVPQTREEFEKYYNTSSPARTRLPTQIKKVHTQWLANEMPIDQRLEQFQLRRFVFIVYFLVNCRLVKKNYVKSR